MNDTPTPEQVLDDGWVQVTTTDIYPSTRRKTGAEHLAALAAAGYRVYPEPDEDTQLTPSHSATLRELELARAERDAAMARAEAAEARLQDSWYVDIGARLDAAEVEAQRLREGIERHREATAANFAAKGIAPGADDLSLWALLAEQLEGRSE